MRAVIRLIHCQTDTNFDSHRRNYKFYPFFLVLYYKFYPFFLVLIYKNYLFIARKKLDRVGQRPDFLSRGNRSELEPAFFIPTFKVDAFRHAFAALRLLNDRTAEVIPGRFPDETCRGRRASAPLPAIRAKRCYSMTGAYSQHHRPSTSLQLQRCEGKQICILCVSAIKAWPR